MKRKKLAAAKPTQDAMRRAQDLALQAMQAVDKDEAARLARQALEIDPGCPDALMLVATGGESRTEQYAVLLLDAVRNGQRRLGKQFFRENSGRFWQLRESRPYMLARFALGEALVILHEVLSAIGHFEDLLELNPNDDQGARRYLAGLYLAAGDWPRARRLLNRFAQERCPTLRWSKVLLDVSEERLEDAQASYAEAMSLNPHFPSIMLAEDPPRFHDEPAPGSKGEAAEIAAYLSRAWFRSLAGMEFLRVQHNSAHFLGKPN